MPIVFRQFTLLLSNLLFASSSAFSSASLSLNNGSQFLPIATTSLSSQASQHNFLGQMGRLSEQKDPTLPTMIVFDLDDCLWSPEMYTLWSKPSIPVEGDLGDGSRGVVGVKVPPSGPTVTLFPGARKVLRELATDPKYAHVLIGAASSSEEPTYSYSCLENIEILPGLTMRQMFHYDEIGRTGKLSSDKRTHFRALHQDSQVPYEEMLFFDDCNWGDHCAVVTREFGVVSQRTPSGLQYSEFLEALETYKKQAEKRAQGY